MDSRLRQLHKQYKSGNVDAGLDLIANYLRLGKLNPRYIEIAAAYGHPLAKHWMGYQPLERNVIPLDRGDMTTLLPELYFRRALGQIRHTYLVIETALPLPDNLSYTSTATHYPASFDILELLAESFSFMEKMLDDIPLSCEIFNDWEDVYYHSTVEDQFYGNTQDWSFGLLYYVSELPSEPQVPLPIRCLAKAYIRYFMMWWDFCERDPDHVSRHVLGITANCIKAHRLIDQDMDATAGSWASPTSELLNDTDYFVVKAGQGLLPFLIGPIS